MGFQVYKELVEKTKTTPGAKVENNKFCLSVHYRCVDEKVGIGHHKIVIHYAVTVLLKLILTNCDPWKIKKWSGLAQVVKSVLKEYPKLRLTQGRKVRRGI